MAVDADEFDLIINTWAAEQADRRRPTPARPDTAGSEIDHGPDEADGDSGAENNDSVSNPGADLVGVAVDGKAVRGAKRADGTQVQLLAALRHDTGIVIGQRNVILRADATAGTLQVADASLLARALDALERLEAGTDR